MQWVKSNISKSNKNYLILTILGRMKYHNNKKTIEDFISYKLENSFESESCRNAFKLQKKYQKILDHTVENIIAKNNQVKFQNLEYKKTKEKVWKKILDISNAIKVYEDQKYLYVNKMRQIIQSKQNKQRQIEEKRRQIKNRQDALTQQIQTMHEQGQYYFLEKKRDIENLKKNTVQMKGTIGQYEPLVQKYYDTLIVKESILGKIDQIRKEIQNKVKQLWEISQKLESLQKEKKEKLNERQKFEKNQIANRKKEINLFIENINDCIQISDELQDTEKQKQRVSNIIKSIQERKIRYAALEKDEKQFQTPLIDIINSDKFSQIKSIMGVSKTQSHIQSEPSTPLSANKKSRHSPDPIASVNEAYTQNIKENIHKMEKCIMDLQVERIKLKQKEDEVDIIENKKDKQIKSLSETLEKMKISLGEK